MMSTGGSSSPRSFVMSPKCSIPGRRSRVTRMDGERLYLAGPQRHDAVMDGRQREAADAVEQAPHGDNSHFAAATTVRAILTAFCAV